MKYRITAALLWSTIIFTLFSCNPAEDEPALLRIEGVNVITTSGQGEPTHNITEISVSADNSPIGIFPLPAEVPVFFEGPTEFVIAPIIRENGIRDNPRTYFPLDFDVRTVDLVKGVNNDPISIDFKYRPTARFAFIEDFEDGVSVFGRDADMDASTFMTADSPEVFSGSQSGRLTVDADSPLNAVTHVVPFTDVLDADRSIYLELDYRVTSDVVFSISTIRSISGTNQAVNQLILRPRDNWNKIYYDISDSFRILGIQGISLLLALNNTVDTPEGEVYLDNIKLVYE